MISYNKLFHILIDKKMKIQEFRNLTGLSQPTISRLRNGLVVRTDVIDKICEALNVQPTEIMEYVPGDISDR